MLAAAALRLAVIEALCPTDAVNAPNDSPIPFPTLAEHRVFDSQQITVDKLDRSRPWTPSLSVFTEDAVIDRRGNAAPSSIGRAMVDLVVIVDFAEYAEFEPGVPSAPTMVEGDPRALLEMEALAAQVRKVLVQSPRGAALRKIMASVEQTSIKRFILPDYNVRLMSLAITFSCQIADDKFTDLAGLPEPLKTVASELPDGGYAKSKLLQLAAAFEATTREQLEAIDIHTTTNGQPLIAPAAS